MNNSLNLRPYLKLLYQFSQLLRITEFQFNPSTRRLEYCRSRARISRFIFMVLAIVCGANLVLTLFFIFIWYVNLNLFVRWTSVIAQVDTLGYSCVIFEYFSTYMFAMNFLRLGHTLLPVANEMLDIFTLIKTKSKSGIFLPVSFLAALVIKVLVCLLQILCNLLENMLSTMSLDVLLPCGWVLANTVFFGHMYSQLVLVCVYQKMNDFLEVAAEDMTQRELTRTIRDLLVVSFRVHQVKRSLNRFSSPLFLLTYLGLFLGLCRFYVILECLLYYSFNEDLKERLLDYTSRLVWTLPSMLTVSYNVYLIGRVSDMAVQSEIMFEERILVLFNRNMVKRTKSVKREVDQLMLRSKVYEYNHRECGIFKMDPQFSLHVITNVVLVNVLICLQFYYISVRE